MSNLKEKKEDYILSLDNSCQLTKMDIVEQNLNAIDFGYELCKREYEEKLRWVTIYEPPKTAELVIVDSGENLHACVAVAFFENGIWKYANGQKLWFAPRRWRRFL